LIKLAKLTTTLQIISIIIVALIITSTVLPGNTSADEIGSEAFGSALGRFNSIKAADIDDDGNVEIVFGNMEGFIYVIEASKENEFRKEWQSGFIDTRLWGTELGDVDSDGKMDIVTGGWDGYTYAYDAITHERKWRSDKMKSDAHGTFIADSDGDNETEVIVGTGYRIDAGRAHVLSGANGTHEWSSDIIQKDGFTGHSYRGTNVHDIDNDGTNEILVGYALKQGETEGEGYFRVFDGKTYELEYESPNLGGDVEAIEVADVDDDGELEIITVAGYRLRPGWVYVFDAATYAQEWKSPDYGPKPYGLDVADVDNDGVLEIITGNQAGIVRVINGISHKVEWKSDILGVDALGIEVADVNQDGTPDIIVGVGGYRGKSGYSSTYSQGFIYIFDGKTHNLLWKVGELDWVKWGYQVVALMAIVVILIGLNRYLKRRHAIKHAGAATGRLGSAERLSVKLTANQKASRFKFKHK
jgi:outer membrane protein assembly factor BamB